MLKRAVLMKGSDLGRRCAGGCRKTENEGA
jgi:hypothetical protein